MTETENSTFQKNKNNNHAFIKYYGNEPEWEREEAFRSVVKV